MPSLETLIEHNDPDPLLREIDLRCAKRDWEGVMEIRTRCNAATERGKTLWGVAEHASYRLALEAPGEYVGLVLDTGAGPLALGPLPEVAASTHEWGELASHIDEGPLRGITAYECVAFGEDLSADESLAKHQLAFELPLRTFNWEPEYPKPEYLDNDAKFPAPVIAPITERAIIPGEAELLDERQLLETWRALVTPWLTQSNGTAYIAIVEGSIDTAIREVDEQVSTVSEIDGNTALQWMGWAAASGGAHGRRRGIASGRRSTWLAVAEACGLMDEGELPNGEELGEHIDSLRWCTWGDVDLSTGWHLRLAVHDEVDNVSVAINAADALE